MPEFNLVINFSNKDLERLYSTGSYVVIDKPTKDRPPNVAWLVFKPLQMNNVNWEEQYGIYASTVQIQNGARLTKMSQTEFPAVENKIYTLNAAGVFTGPSGVGTEASFTAVNNYNNLPTLGYLTFGLYQDANVNGQSVVGNAISAVQVLYESIAVMTPDTTIYIWIQSFIHSNEVVTNITSQMTQVTFGGTVTNVALTYDAQSGKFLPSTTSNV